MRHVRFAARIFQATARLRRAVARALGRAERRLDLARRDAPRIDRARTALLEQRRATRDEIRDTDQALSALATRDELVLRTRDAINAESYVRGRIAQYLETTEDTETPSSGSSNGRQPGPRRTWPRWPTRSMQTRSIPHGLCCAPSVVR